MRLIGMLDSPYVRRTAISMTFLGVPFRHEAVSVFADFEQFRRIVGVKGLPLFNRKNRESFVGLPFFVPSGLGGLSISHRRG